MTATDSAAPGADVSGSNGRGSPVAGRFEGEHVLVPRLTADVPAVTDQLKVAAALARPSGATLSVLNPTATPARAPETFRPTVEDADDETLLSWAMDQTAGPPAGGFAYTRDVIGGVLSTVRSRAVDTLVLPGAPGEHRLREGLTKRIAAHADCDVVTVNGKTGYDRVASVLLPVAGGPHSGLAADIARSIADDSGAWVDVLHVLPENPTGQARTEARDLVDAVAARIDRPETTSTWLLEAEDVVEVITEQSRCYGLTILGAPTKGRLRRFVGGSTNRSVRAKARSAVLSTRNNGHR